MPKTANNLWEQIISWENLVSAYHETRKGKRFKADVMRFHRRWEENLLNIHNHLIWGSWEPSPFASFPVYDPKPRVIDAPQFKDRVIHHALHRIVEPYFERRFIDHSYACRKGKGTHAAVGSVQRMLRKAQAKWGTVYVLQGDIARYFPSIGHDRLMQQIEKVISDRKVIDLWNKINQPHGSEGIGIPIGALTSQISANVYLDVMDHYATDDLGYGFYARYMDDWIILAPCKEDLRRLLCHLELWLHSELGLVINPKSTVYPASQGINFAGYRIWSTHMLPRKQNVQRAKNRMRSLVQGYKHGRVDRSEISSSWASFLGYLKHCESRETRKGIINDMVAIMRD